MTNCNEISKVSKHILEIKDNGVEAKIFIDDIDISDMIKKYEIVRKNSIGNELILTIPLVETKLQINS